MTIGILGGGQLGRMIALAGYPLGLQFKVFDPSPEAVAGHVAPLLSEDPNDPLALGWFSKGLDVVTYEWENVPLQSAQYLAQRSPVFPPPRALEIAQDRWKEKSFFLENGIPTPAFYAIQSRNDFDLALAEIGLPSVLKTRRFGYDGKGQFVLSSAQDAENAWRELGGVPLILEAFVPFDREVSILAVRARGGQTKFYPLIENHHADGILRLSLSPAPGLISTLQADAEHFAGKILEKLGYVGVLTLELFQVGERLLANEIAPRVHNSGHLTIEGHKCSQFENHIRAIAGWPLGQTHMKVPCAAMINLIGQVPPLTEILEIEGAHPHLYGKEARSNRKVGHVTIIADDFSMLEQRIATMQKLAG